MMRRLSILLATMVVLSGIAQASKYEDKKHGFTITILKDWSQTPTQPNETIEVAKFKDDRDRDFADLSIYRFAVAGSGVATPDAEDDGWDEDDGWEEEDIPEIPEGWGLPDNAVDYLSAVLDRMAKQLTGKEFVLPKPKEVKFGKSIKGNIYTFEFKSKRWRSASTFHMAGIVNNGSEEYLILYSTPLNRSKKMKSGFVASIRSFRFRDSDAEEEEDDGARGIVLGDPDELLDLEKREKIKKNLVGTWRYIDTKHYIIIFNCDVGLAKYIARRMEYMRKFAFERVFPPVEPIQEAMVVRVCKEMDEYYHYGAPRGSAGYWYSVDDELVFPDLAQSKKPDVKTVGVMAHEGFHQYIHYALLKHSPPIWFNEGYAEYFFCVNFKYWGEKKLKFDKRHPMRHSTVKNALGTGSLMPIKDFIKLSQRQYYAPSRVQLCYSQGWAFATWLKNITRNERYQEIPEILFAEMQKGYLKQAQDAADAEDDENGFPGLPPGFGRGKDKVIEDAMNKAFEGIDLDELNKDFLKGIKRAM